jgi:flagellar biosynthesis/type III secretory pathway chaperone
MIFARKVDDVLLSKLADILDEEISLLNAKSEQLEALSAALIERDDEAMQSLLDEMERTQRAQAAADVKLEAVRGSLAALAGRKPACVTLAEIIDSLDDEPRAEMDSRRGQIVVLARHLRHKHLSAVLLLAESARINRLFLERLFPSCRPVRTYGAKGADSWRAEAGLFDAEM